MPLCKQLMMKAVPQGEKLMANIEIWAAPVFTEAYELVPVDDSQLRLRITWDQEVFKEPWILHNASDIDNSP
ncbi:hypothetical protein BC332_01591 [Capsicum chinense]|nr:hypothetical protein BC332_01591 [Capsicum chinense]